MVIIKMNQHKSIVFILGLAVVCSTVGIGLVPTALASGKSIYGTLYIDGEIADPGVTITMKIDDVIVDQTTTVDWDEDNFILGFNSSYKGKTAYFYVGEDNLVPDDNPSLYIGSWIGQRLDLHVTTSTSDGEGSSTGGPSGGGGGFNPSSGSNDEDVDTGGPGGGGTMNSPPEAEIIAPSSGKTNEEIKFDATNSSDPDGDALSYNWDFGDGNTATGVLVGHTYTNIGNFTVTLTVSDGALSDDDTIEITIDIGNFPPTDLDITGETNGHVNETMSFSIVASDPDEDFIRYIIDWADGTNDTMSGYHKSGESFVANHSFGSYGSYTISVTAEDTQRDSITETKVINIDVITIDGDITGYLVDDPSDGDYDFFEHNTGEKRPIQNQDDGTTIINSDGKGDWDYVYNHETETLSKYSGVDSLYLIIGVIGAIIAVVLLLLYLFKRRREDIAS